MMGCEIVYRKFQQQKSCTPLSFCLQSPRRPQSMAGNKDYPSVFTVIRRHTITRPRGDVSPGNGITLEIMSCRSMGTLIYGLRTASGAPTDRTCHPCEEADLLLDN